MCSGVPAAAGLSFCLGNSLSLAFLDFVPFWRQAQSVDLFWGPSGSEQKFASFPLGSLEEGEASDRSHQLPGMNWWLADLNLWFFLRATGQLPETPPNHQIEVIHG